MLRKLTITLLCVSLVSQLGAKPGPVSGAIAYWATKTICYGTAVAATGAIVVGTGGAAGAVTSVAAAAATGGSGPGWRSGSWRRTPGRPGMGG